MPDQEKQADTLEDNSKTASVTAAKPSRQSIKGLKEYLLSRDEFHGEENWNDNVLLPIDVRHSLVGFDTRGGDNREDNTDGFSPMPLDEWIVGLRA